MNIQQKEHTLNIRGLRELTAANARSIRDVLCASVVPGTKIIEVDLSEISFVDGCGLGALVALYKTASEQNEEVTPVIRLLNPQPPVRQLIELTRMHQLFDIVPIEDETVEAAPIPDPMPRAAHAA
jgi:anti-sigma B factor antagonist